LILSLKDRRSSDESESDHEQPPEGEYVIKQETDSAKELLGAKIDLQLSTKSPVMNSSITMESPRIIHSLEALSALSTGEFILKPSANNPANSVETTKQIENSSSNLIEKIESFSVEEESNDGQQNSSLSENSSGTDSSSPSVSPSLSRKRGRPRKSPDSSFGNGIDENSPKGSDVSPISGDVIISAANTNLVRTIPCFFNQCGWSYTRAGSDVVELSDRPLPLLPKYRGYLIRCCKKHFEQWKTIEGWDCEVCKGMNCVQSETSQDYNNKKGISFNLCKSCSIRQEQILLL